MSNVWFDIQDVKILRGTTTDAVEKTLKGLLLEGWVPQGGIFQDEDGRFAILVVKNGKGSVDETDHQRIQDSV